MAIGGVFLPIMSGGGGVNYTVDVFTSSGTWNKPSNLDHIYALIVSGGGGGGAGRRGAASSNRGGGLGRNGGALFAKFLNSELSATESVTVGSGGAGAAAQTNNTTNGASGASGGASEFKYGSTFRISGGGSTGGSTSITTASSGALSFNITSNRYAFLNCYNNPSSVGNASMSDSYRVNAGITSSNYNLMFSNTSVGGQISSANAQIKSGTIGGFYDNTNTLIDETVGVGEGTNGIQPTEFITFGEILGKIFPWFDPADANYNVGRGGIGGGPGNTAGTVAGGNGANALGYGAGGGGGGASTNGANSGAGGNGTGGIVIIINVLTS